MIKYISLILIFGGIGSCTYAFTMPRSGGGLETIPPAIIGWISLIAGIVLRTFGSLDKNKFNQATIIKHLNHYSIDENNRLSNYDTNKVLAILILSHLVCLKNIMRIEEHSLNSLFFVLMLALLSTYLVYQLKYLKKLQIISLSLLTLVTLLILLLYGAINLLGNQCEALLQFILCYFNYINIHVFIKIYTGSNKLNER